MQIWRIHFPFVRLRRVLRFYKCPVCVAFRVSKGRKLDAKATKELQSSKLRHHTDIKEFRAEAMHKAILGQTEPQTYLSIAQDAVDAMHKGFPKTQEFTQEEDKYKLKSKVMINMVHGESVHYYIMPENIHGGPNESVEALQRTLAKCKASRGKLPPVLFLQVDNSQRECKNTYMFAYLAWF